MTTQPNIDLNTCVPGQKVRLRSGGIADYLGLIENNISLIYLHQLSSGKYVSNGCYWFDQRTDELDVVEILPLKSPMNIDLNTCIKGQQVKLRNGTIGIYYGLRYGDEMYPHNVQGYHYRSNGKYWNDKRVSEFDVIEILSLKSPMNIDLNTCVPGQKVELRDGTIATYNGVRDENEIYPHSVDDYSYTKRGTFWEEPDRTSPKDVVEIIPLEYDYKLNEEEFTQPTPEPTHSITNQIDVANPDHVSIIPHEHGVTICIKKGLTTISWRHYNS
jgi:hypothetical protein